MIFIKERFFIFVPFGNQLKDVVEEIIVQFQEFQKLTSMKYLTNKFYLVYSKIYYLYRYFGVKQKIARTVRFIRLKLLDIGQTALQAESRYRQAKTNFIYDPIHGLMFLEQKLPISWHAFNQTPEFQELPEYRAVVDLTSYFSGSNTTFWSIYYKLKPLTEPENWFPPFKGIAL